MNKLTIFLSAFLLFVIEPVIGKRLLPIFGGSASVWTALMLFFTTALFAGYLYATQLTRLSESSRRWIHTSVILASVAILTTQTGWNWSHFLPFFLLSSTSSLLAQSLPLYALANAGALLGLAAYPFLIEPALTLSLQERLWTVLFVTTSLMLLKLTWSGHIKTAKTPRLWFTKIPPRRLIQWLLLSLLSNVMLLSTTSYITQQVAPVPLLWLTPLALYLLSFILAFSGNSWYFPKFQGVILMLTLLLAGAVYTQFFRTSYLVSLLVFLGTQFLTNLTSHAELYRRRPNRSSLPLFYLTIAFGGVLAALFCAVAAPLIFPDFWEISLSLIGGLVLAAGVLAPPFSLSAIPAIVILLILHWYQASLVAPGTKTLAKIRNFYGVVRVAEVSEKGSPVARELYHGTTLHGAQLTGPGLQTVPMIYKDSGLEAAINRHPKRVAGKPLRLGIIGLGTGTIAAYCLPGDEITFYEINNEIIRLSDAFFSYIKDCRGRGGKLSIIPGDARLSLTKEQKTNESNQFDILVVDAFNDNAVPTHLLTREAFSLYRSHLSEEGLMAIHITNQDIDLFPVVAASAAPLGLKTYAFVNPQGFWFLISSSPLPFATDLSTLPVKPIRAWTDDYSNILQVLKKLKN